MNETNNQFNLELQKQIDGTLPKGHIYQLGKPGGLYPKDNAEWLNWIVHGKALYIDKTRIQILIYQQRRTLAEVEYLNLDSAAKIIKNFTNPPKI